MEFQCPVFLCLKLATNKIVFSPIFLECYWIPSSLFVYWLSFEKMKIKLKWFETFYFFLFYYNSQIVYHMLLEIIITIILWLYVSARKNNKEVSKFLFCNVIEFLIWRKNTKMYWNPVSKNFCRKYLCTYMNLHQLIWTT